MHTFPVVAMAILGIALAVLVIGILRFASGGLGGTRDRVEGASSGSTSGAFGELVEVFQPTRVYTSDELRRQDLDIVQTPPNERGVVVDLDSGTVTIATDEMDTRPTKRW